MSGPFPFSRQVMPLDTMLEQMGGAGWDGLERMFQPGKVADAFEPEAEQKKFLAAWYRTAQGRAFFDWIADLTVRAPFPHVGGARDTAWIAAAKHEARCAVGAVIFKAIADGNDLLNKPKEPRDERTD